VPRSALFVRGVCETEPPVSDHAGEGALSFQRHRQKARVRTAPRPFSYSGAIVPPVRRTTSRNEQTERTVGAIPAI
jgi:hypothetical protein